MSPSVINITPTSSGEGLREKLEKEATKRGRIIRPFVSKILTYAANHKDEFQNPLKIPLTKPGKHIGTDVPKDIKQKLQKCAKAKKTSLGRICCYILEFAIEEKMLDKIFKAKNDE